jgi:hypothetical protein
MQDKLTGVQGFLGTLDPENPREIVVAVEVGEMAANYAQELLVHFGLTYSDGPPPSPINLMQAQFVVSNLQGTVQEYILLHQESLKPNSYDEIVQTAKDVLNTDASDLTQPSPPEEINPLIVDRNTFSIQWRGLTCRLGNTNEFKLIEFLNNKVGKYVGNSDLIDDVWDGSGEFKNVQKAVSNLRRKFREAGMHQITISNEKGHYSLNLP